MRSARSRRDRSLETVRRYFEGYHGKPTSSGSARGRCAPCWRHPEKALGVLAQTLTQAGVELRTSTSVDPTRVAP
jgi:hypothetical protein